MRRQDIKVGQMYVYRCRRRDQNCRVYRSFVIEYRVRVVDLGDRQAKVELHYRDGFHVGQLHFPIKRGRKTVEVRYATTTIGLRNLYPYAQAWIALK